MGIGSPQVIDPPEIVAVFDAHAHPDVRGPLDNAVQVFETLRAFRKHLVFVPVRLIHHVEYLPDVLDWNAFVEEIAHAVHENALWLLDVQRFFQLLRDEPEVGTLFKRMRRNTAEALRKSLGVTVFAPWADLGAATDRVPCCIRPLDLCRCHFKSLCFILYWLKISFTISMPASFWEAK